MASLKTPTREELRKAWPDTRLVKECLEGSEQAWSALIEQYKNLDLLYPDQVRIFPGRCFRRFSGGLP